jgi:hypothetical protein
VAKRAGSHCCSNRCRAKLSRDKHKVFVEAQSEMIRTQTMVLGKVISDPDKVVESVPADGVVQELSCKVGKDLTECKRPDGTHLYTDKDLYTLRKEIHDLLLNTDEGNLLSVMNTNQMCQELIWKFEREFKCRFESLGIPNPIKNTFRVKR